MDELLFKSKGRNPISYWRPGKGRPIAQRDPAYQKFEQVVRTVHVQDALIICRDYGMEPRPVVSPSILNNRILRSSNHPCKNIRVLWFGTKPASNFGQDDCHDWYGNVQFGMSVEVLQRCWKYCYLVEIMTAKTHTSTRLLITNNNYSSILPSYNPKLFGGPWYSNSEGHFVLEDCSRFNDEGTNRNGHSLEFMIEVTPFGQRAILDECFISFRNHSRANDPNLPLRCHRTQFSSQFCCSPLTSAAASRVFFDQHQRNVSRIATPRLSEEAEYFRKCFFMMTNNALPLQQPLSRDQQLMIPELQPPPVPRGPPLLHTHFQNPPNPHSIGSLEHISTGLFQHPGNNSKFYMHQRIQASWGDSGKMYGFQQTNNHIWNPGTSTSWADNQYYLRMQQTGNGRMVANARKPQHGSWGEWEEKQRRRKEEILRQQQGGHDSQFIAQHHNPKFVAQQNTAIRDQQMLWNWWLSCSDRYRGFLQWFSRQEQRPETSLISRWPSPQQHNYHRG